MEIKIQVVKIERAAPTCVVPSVDPQLIIFPRQQPELPDWTSPRVRKPHALVFVLSLSKYEMSAVDEMPV